MQIRITPFQKQILDELRSAKLADSPFIKLAYSRTTLGRLVNRGLIFASKGLDGTRYTITNPGLTALHQSLIAPKNFFWNGNGYPTIYALAVGENMSYIQARYRVKMGYTKSSDMPNNQAVIVDNQLFANVNDAAKKLGRSPKSIRMSIKRRERKTPVRPLLDVVLSRKKEAFEKILKGGK